MKSGVRWAAGAFEMLALQDKGNGTMTNHDVKTAVPLANRALSA